MEVTLAFPLLVGLIAVALFFDFLNGLHDAANSIATIVSTRVLRPQYAVLWAAFFNFIAFLFFGLHVAETLGTGIISAEVVDPPSSVFSIAWSNCLEPAHLDVRNTLQQLSCPYWRSGRSGGCQGRRRRHCLVGSLENHRRYRGVARDRVHLGVGPRACRFLDLRAQHAICGRQNVSSAAIRFSIALFTRPWWQRRSEDHGYYCRASVFARIARARILCAFLGGHFLPIGLGSRNAIRRVAYRPHHGFQNHTA